MSDDRNISPEVLDEPVSSETTDNGNIWMRGLFMIILAILFGVGEAILGLAAIIQFFWMLFTKERNKPIASFGADLSDWLARVARFQTASTEDKPFPFAKWGQVSK